MKKNGCPLFPLFLLIFVSSAAYAADIQWTGKDNTSSWDDYLNWFPETVPTTGDNVIIDTAGADVVLGQTYNVKSLRVGEHNTASLTIENFTYGTITPENLTDNAIYIGKNGTLNLSGPAGVTTVKGTLAISNVVGVAEPSFMLKVE
ncbi:MAG: hypothetical protein Q8O22_05355 [Candidatus Omnitrophota bacterium]|nr:hypothetical protein [Candidatus Omnitrophota bacterium]